MIAIFNSGLHSQSLPLPEGKWGICIHAENAGTEILKTVEGTATAEGLSALVLIKVDA